MFSLRTASIADNAHRGISILDFVLMLVVKDNQLWEDQEACNGVTSLALAVVRISKRKCPVIPTTFDQFGFLLRHYIKAGYIIFTPSCHHFQDAVHMKRFAVNVQDTWGPSAG